MSNSNNNANSALIPCSIIDIAKSIYWYIQCTTTRYPVLIQGRHGIGKTQIIEQLANYLNLEYLNRRASQDTEGDLVGIPEINKKEKYVEFYPMKWLRDASNTATLLHIDEIDRACTEVAQGYFQLADSRRIGEVELHKDSMIVSCVNGGGEQGKNYRGIRPMGAAEFSRWGIFALRYSTKEYIDWANGNDAFAVAFKSMPKMPKGKKYNDYVENRKGKTLHKILQEFISEHPNFGNSEGDLADNTVYPCPRSWTRLSQIITPILYIWEKGKGKISPDLKNILQLIIQSQVGQNISIRLERYMADYTFRVSAQDILDGNKTKMATIKEMAKDPVKNQPIFSELLADLFHSTPNPDPEQSGSVIHDNFGNFSMCDEYNEEDSELTPELKEALDRVEKIKTFFHLLPAELQATMWKTYMIDVPMWWTAHFYGMDSAGKEAKSLQNLGVLSKDKKNKKKK